MIEKLILELKQALGPDRVKEHEPLSKQTTMRIGGPARVFVITKNSEELLSTIITTRKYHVPFFILGGGTNTIASDKGFDGLIIKNNSTNIKVKSYRGLITSKSPKKSHVIVVVDSGVQVNFLVRFTLEQNLSGIEAFLGQPGTVGGAMYINAHNMSMGEYFGDKILKARILTKDNKIIEVDRTYFHFGYDDSILQHESSIVLQVEIGLTSGNHEVIWEKANQAQLHRKNTQPLGIGSSGCTFRNITKAQALKIGTPGFTTSAGFLLDVCGLKGLVIGGAKYSETHANFIVNFNKATSKDIEELIATGRRKVKQRFGIELKEEVVRPKLIH